MSHDVNTKYAFILDFAGYITSRNPSNGKQAFIEFKAGTSSDDVSYYDLATDNSMDGQTFTVYFKNVDNPPTSYTDVATVSYTHLTLPTSDLV